MELEGRLGDARGEDPFSVQVDDNAFTLIAQRNARAVMAPNLLSSLFTALMETWGAFVSDWLYGPGNQFNSAKDIPDLTGRTVIVTGGMFFVLIPEPQHHSGSHLPGNNGLGLESSLKLAKANAHVYLAARSASKAYAAISSIKKSVPNAQITHLQLDLTSLGSIKDAADQFSKSSDRLDVLMNNAGVMALPRGTTADGYEIQFGTNHVGHALFTKLLMPTLLKTVELGADVRIINVSSDGHRLAPIGGLVLEYVKTDMQTYNTWTRYGHSKLANILFTKALAQRYPNIKSIALHPGGVDTGLAFPFMEGHPWLTAVLKPLLWWSLKTPEQGAQTQLFAAVSPAAKSGSYYTPTAKETTPTEFARNPELADKLWDWTEMELKGHGF